MTELARRGPFARLDPRTRALLALSLLVPVPSLAVALALIGTPGPAGRALWALAKVWTLAFPALWYLAVERGRPSWSPPRRGGLLVGAGLGVVSATLILAVFWLFEPRIDPARLAATTQRMTIASPAAFLGAAAYWVLVNSVLEEYVWRWFVFAMLERLMPPSLAILGSAVAFTLHHAVALQVYLDWNLVALASTGVLLGGASWSWCYWRFRSIWPGWVAHALADVAVFAAGWKLLFG